MSKRTGIFLGIIFFLACALRLYKLAEYPVGFHIDEASLGYNGYSMLKTGKDESGRSFPLYIDMFGDKRPSGYHYLTIPSIALFGLNEFSTRFPGALFGALSTFAFYFLVLAIFKHKSIALWSAALLAIAPWHVNLSRASSESIVALFFILVGFALVIESTGKSRIVRFVFGMISLLLSFFFYHTPRVFVPFFLVALCFLLRQSFVRTTRKYKAVSLIFFLVLCTTSFLLIFVVGGGTGRFKQVSIFGYPETRLVLEEQYREDGVGGVPLVATRAFHNKYVNYALTYVANYLEYFNGQFLFIKGGLPIWYTIANLGLLYLVELPFLVFGLIRLFQKRRIEWYIPLVWVLIAPLTAAVTTDDIPNIQRAVVLFPALEVIAAYGVWSMVSARHNGIYQVVLSLVIAVAFIGNSGYFLHQYTVHSKLHRPWYRNNGFDEMVRSVKDAYDAYDAVVVTKSLGGIYPHVLFYMRYDPASYQREGSPKDRDFGGFGKFIFVPQACPVTLQDSLFLRYPRILYVNAGTCDIVSAAPHKDIVREDGTRAFVIVY